MTERPDREFYLRAAPLEEALSRWRETWRRLNLRGRLGREEVPVEAALGRVTAGPVVARASSPHYHAAAMDGIAVRAAETAGASPVSPRRLRVGTDAVYVNTGDPLPEDTDAVIMIEEVAEVAPGELEITAAATPWQHTRVIGEDIIATDVLVPGGQRLRPADLGALLAGGVLRVEVMARPKVVVIPTGQEIVPPGQAVAPGQIPDFNTPMICARLLEDGAEPIRRGPAPDDPAAIADELRQAAAEADVVLTIGGASAGARDHTAQALQRAGELLVHGVAIRPGKPVALGVVAGCPVVALPGYPVSAMLAYDLFVAPLIACLLGTAVPPRPTVKAVLARKLASVPGSQEFVRVRLAEVSGRVVAVPSPRGAGLMTSLARADALLRIPATSEGFPKGAEVECELLRTDRDPRNTILVIGSHDFALDLLAEQVRHRDPDLALISLHVGSMAGLAALHDGFCHVAGTHLLDPETGEYNFGYVRQLFGQRPVTLVTLAHRQQGFIVAPGNPKGIREWRDLARPDVLFVNRQPGAGTRVLLDFHLRQAGVRPEQVNGYHREVFTHLAVASMVANGTADVGLGILAAARALGLDFVPLAEERYDLAALPEFWQSPRGAALLAVLRDPEFARHLSAFGGYDTRETGVTQERENRPR